VSPAALPAPDQARGSNIVGPQGPTSAGSHILSISAAQRLNAVCASSSFADGCPAVASLLARAPTAISISRRSFFKSKPAGLADALARFAEVFRLPAAFFVPLARVEEALDFRDLLRVLATWTLLLELS
jgi:hypothetical protein